MVNHPNRSKLPTNPDHKCLIGYTANCSCGWQSAATTLRQIGEAMYGPHWQAPLADALGVGKRSVQRWAAGSAPVPADLWPRLSDLLAARSTRIDELSRHLAGALGADEPERPEAA